MKTGTYNSFLPNCVLTDFSLPWARPIDPDKPDDYKGTPWLGLLTIYPEEMKTVGIIDGPNRIELSDLVEKKDDDVLRPDLIANDIGLDLKATQVTVVDMAISTFQAISPRLEELPFLSHGREVNTGGKVMLGMKGDGLFSLLIGNRIPKSGTDKDPAENNVFIVSFEGHSQYLRNGTGKIPTGKTKIRLVFLGSWKFNATEAKGDFLEMMENLCTKGNGGVKLMQMPGGDKIANDRTAKEALEIGFTALQNDMRAGENATSWYRGPLVPSPTKRVYSVEKPCLYSDHAIHYDPKVGIFNHAYSAAWQIGRLLALSDGTFSKAFFEWRNKYIYRLNQWAARQKVDENISAIVKTGNEQDLKQMTPHEGLRHVFANKFKGVDWPTFSARHERVLGQHLPGILSENERKDILENDEDPLLAILEK